MTNLWESDVQVWLYSQPTDVRKGACGLSHLVAEEFKMSPQSGDLFVFMNRSKNRVKLIFWHYNGFCMLYKRLEKDVFKLPKDGSTHLKLNDRQLYRLLEGLHFINEEEKKDLVYY